jgi:hypothetical protein
MKVAKGGEVVEVGGKLSSLFRRRFLEEQHEETKNTRKV